MCGNRSFRLAESSEISENKSATNQPQKCNCGCKKDANTNSPVENEDRPHTPEELRKMKEELDEMKAYHKWCERCNDAAMEQAQIEETALVIKILKAQEKIRNDFEHKRAQKLAAAAMEDEAWVFEKAANGWI